MTQATPQNPFAHLGINAKGGKRACGEGRTAGSVYVECGLFLNGTPIERYLHDPPNIIQTAQYGINKRGVVIIKQKGVSHIVDWVGEEYYKYPADFIEEARRMGVSRKITPTADFSALGPSSMLFLIHPKGSMYNMREVSVDAQFICPNAKHKQGDACCGMHWSIPGNENNERELASGETYPVTPLPPEAQQPKYAPAIFMGVPISAISLIKNHDGGHNEETWRNVNKAGVPTSLVDY